MDNSVENLRPGDEQHFIDVVRVGGLLQYNKEQTKGKIMEPDIEIRKVVRDAAGSIIAGIGCSTYLSSLEVEVLWVHKEHQKQGHAAKLLQAAECEAKQAGCTLAHLTTYSFQAPRFYQKMGYHICGEIDGFPDGIKLYALKKEL